MTKLITDEMTKSETPTKKTAGEFTLELICESFEEKYGRGWKRRLAEAAGVPESNVHSWIKAGKMPPWILRIFRLLVLNARLQRENEALSRRVDDFVKCDQVIESDDGFAVFRFRDGVGKLMARGIPEVETAIEYASVPRLKALNDQVMSLLWELRENEVIPADSMPGSWRSDADELLNQPNWSRLAMLHDPDTKTIDINDVFRDVAEALEALPAQMTSST